MAAFPLPAGPLPGTFVILAAELEALLAIQRRYERLVAFLGAKTVETSLSRGHSSEFPNPDPWIMGYSIETEHDGCYRFQVLAEGPDRDDAIDRGLDAWDRDVAEWCAADVDED